MWTRRRQQNRGHTGAWSLWDQEEMWQRLAKDDDTVEPFFEYFFDLDVVVVLGRRGLPPAYVVGPFSRGIVPVNVPRRGLCTQNA